MASKKWTIEKIIEYVENEDYYFIEMVEFNHLNSKITVWCGDKNHKPYNVCFKNFKGNKSCKPNRCSSCKGGIKLSLLEIKDFLKENNLELLSNDYKNVNEELEIRCLTCGNIFKISLRNLKYRIKRDYLPCDICANRKVIDYEYVKSKIEEEEYKILSTTYINAHNKLKIECNKKHIFEMNWNKFQQGRRCPYCNISKGEKRIMSWLENNNIKYIYDQEYFEDLIGLGGGILRPDFIIEDRKIWIEFDGEFHYRDMTGTLEKMKIHDEIKNIYVNENNWELIRIPYWEFDNIEKILKENL